MKKMLLACLLISAFAYSMSSPTNPRQQSSSVDDDNAQTPGAVTIPPDRLEPRAHKLSGGLKFTGATLLALGAGYGVKNIIDELRGKGSDKNGVKERILKKQINMVSVAAWSAATVLAGAACYKLGTSGWSDFKLGTCAVGDPD